MKLIEVMEMTEEAARQYIEKTRWSKGARCPHCGTDRVYELSGKSHRPGLYKCGGCRKQFSVKVGTIMEDSPISYKKWLLAFSLMTASKKGFSAQELHRILGVSYKTAWFVFHRIRHAMSEPTDAPPLDGTVEVDETYVGGKPRIHGEGFTGRGTRKTPVIVLAEREGRARSMPSERVTGKALKGLIRENVAQSARIMTDEFAAYGGLEKEFRGGHETVAHARGEYSRGDVSTNSAESFFALLKRGIHGTYRHVSRQHLARYCDEFSFRWSYRKVSDGERMDAAIQDAEGKRLMYQEQAR